MKTPSSVEIERLLLGNALDSEDMLNSLVCEFDEDDFFDKRHKAIFKAIKELSSVNPSIDPHLVIDFLKTHSKEAEAGGEAYVHEIFQLSIQFHHVSEYSDVLKDHLIGILFQGSAFTQVAKLGDVMVFSFPCKLR